MANKVALITTNVMESPIRTVGGILRDNGIDVHLFNLGTGIETFPDEYPQTIQDQLEAIVRREKISVIGISTADVFLKRGLSLARSLKRKLNTTIIFGGPHVQLYGDNIIKEEPVDAVCVREAYDGVADYVKHITARTTWGKREAPPNFIVKQRDGTLSHGRITPPKRGTELDRTPKPIFSNAKAYVLDERRGVIIPYPKHGAVSPNQHQIGHPNTVVYTGMWGCANTCNFCHVTALVDQARSDSPQVPRVISKGKERIIEELEGLVQENPAAEFINFGDNDFFQRPRSFFEHFAAEYPLRVGLPFYCMASPNTITEEKLGLLIQAGLKELNVGVQASERTNKRYDRRITDGQVVCAARTIAGHTRKGELDVFYDFINFNPAESEEDIRATLDLVKCIPGEFDLVIHHLTLGAALDDLVSFLSEHTGATKEELLDDTNRLDYHNLPTAFLQKFDQQTKGALYSNLILEWIAGRHNAHMVGRLPRRTKDFLAMPSVDGCFPDGTAHLMADDALPQETIDGFFYLPIRRVLDSHKSIVRITEHLPPIVYTNQLKQHAYKRIE